MQSNYLRPSTRYTRCSFSDKCKLYILRLGIGNNNIKITI